MNEDMWIVVIVDEFYPSVYHFKEQEEAKHFYGKVNNMKRGHVVHLAKVKESCVDKEELDERQKMDVEW